MAFSSRVGFLLLVLAVSFEVPATELQSASHHAPGSGGVNAPAQRDKPYLIMVSIDGLRWDYADTRHAPTLRKMARSGVRAERLLPAFPTQTFPNHYTLVTGLLPAHHGIVANEFQFGRSGQWYRYKERASAGNGSAYGGEPIWVTAETQGMVSASYFWVGSEAAILGVRPTHWHNFSKEVTGITRVDQVLKWLAEPAETRPHLYTLYFELVDDYSHWFGPDSQQARKSVKTIDRAIKRLLKGIAKLPHGDQVNIMVMSDHGQARYKPGVAPFILNDHVTLDGTTSIEGGNYVFLYLDHADTARAEAIRDQVNKNWDHGKAWLAADAPAEWHIADNPRFADVIMVADDGHAILSSREKISKIIQGAHGWKPESPDMHGVFIAMGPQFKKGLEIGPVQNVDVYPLAVRTLGLDAPESIDGELERVISVLADH